MQIEVEKLEGLSRRLKVVLPGERVEKAYFERIKEIAKKARMDGFRPGKAPLQIIESRLGNAVLMEVAEELMRSSFQQAIADQHLKIAGSSEMKPGEIVKGQDLKFEVAYETYPDFELVDFDNVVVEKNTAELSDNDVGEMLEKMRYQQASWHEVTRAAKEGDRILIDFEGLIDGKPFAGGSGKDLTVEIGSGQMVEGFEKGLIGQKPGTDCTISVTFPEDYPIIHLANQEAFFKIKVHQIQEPELPELNEDFAKKMGITDGSLQELRNQVRKKMEKELETSLYAQLKDQILNKLMELNSIEAPQAMVNDEIEQLQQFTRHQIAYQYPGQVKDPAKIELPKDPYLDQAKKRVILGLLVGEAIKKYEMKVDKDKVREKIEEIALASPNPEQVAALYHRNKRMLAEVETVVLEDQVVAKLLSQANVVEKKSTYHDVIHPKKK